MIVFGLSIAWFILYLVMGEHHMLVISMIFTAAALIIGAINEKM